MIRKQTWIQKALRRLALALIIPMAFAGWNPALIEAHAENYIRRNWMDTSVTYEQYQAVLDTLRAHVFQDTGADTTQMFDTRVQLAPGTDGYQFCYNFRELFLGRDDFGVCYTAEGFPEMTAEIVESSAQGFGLRYHASGNVTGVPTLFAGWLPGSNPYECMRQHDAASSVLRQVAANAPADDEAAYRYFFDWLCDRVTFDEEYKPTSHSAYSAVIEGSSVCEGYAKSFEALCWMTGRYCRSVTVPGEGPYGLHERNIVYVNGVPKWVDVTWGDKPEGKDYRYLLYDVDVLWRQQLGL